ncbi:Fur family transcriptional regulator, peroxide stress response regulator [Granulicella pectinivorans]|jgi:Fur family peroxide stress response transcriptional regulator|uniref:Fur family transcriptional regulator, peroxide stress response regulator n=1 Tax=Granulicella pectinivorans TaxID=474950 RepID=A0A1I6MP47_9BACT|nr:transcriptional repressor [Granulicella pectinivorans]SFS17414.1 Fur family transcriptional regulator, peroxide stress response regulator [Granulicella pectinivorans]
MAAAADISFRALCEQQGIAVTHQREVLYEVMQSMHGHPSPEEIYAEVRQRIPTISLATVYKNIHLFVESGVLREVSLHHGTVRVEMASSDHHHVVCSRCKSITDIDEAELGLLPKHDRLPGGFLVERYAVDVIGLCAKCQQA